MAENFRLTSANRWYVMKTPISLRLDKNMTMSALFGAGTLLLFQGGILLFVDSAEMSWLKKLLCFSGVIYFALGLAARRFPLPSALFGIVLYAAFLVFECFLDVNFGVNLLMGGLFFEIPIILLLLIAAISPLKCAQIYKLLIMSLCIALVVSLGLLANVVLMNSLWKTEVLGQAVGESVQQAREDVQKGNLRLYELHGENSEDTFSGQRQGKFEIWYAEYHPSVYVMRISEEKWVETYNEFVKVFSSGPSNSTTASIKSDKKPR
jgi:hypothetical protein